MKKFFITLIGTTAIISGIISYTSSVNKPVNALALANIEALSNEENNGCKEERCSRAVVTANCYKPNGEWHSMRIVTVEEYTRESCVIICRHDRVTNCPVGTYEEY